jgi:hypothetical protein
LLLNTYTTNRPSQNPANTNVSFAFLVSSAQRLTFSKSNDPWYLTGDTPSNITYKDANLYEVKRGRPMLSCWQSDTWTIGDKTTSIRNLKELAALPPALVNVLQSALGIPRIITLSQLAGTMALMSSFGMQGRTFNGGSASMTADINRLVLGAYMATKNVFLDATLIDRGPGNEFQNILLNGTNTTDPKEAGAGEFIIYGTDFMALRISVLVAVPVVLVSLFLLVAFLTDSRWFPWPWRGVHAMDATILYNNMMDPDSLSRMEQVSNNTVTPAPLREVDSKIMIRPRYDQRSSSYSWHRVPIE